jgi:hypothetical protein
MSDDPTLPIIEPTRQVANGLHAGPAAVGDASPSVFDMLSTPAEADDLETMLATRPARRKLPRLTLLLAVAAVLGAGFAGGVEAQKHMGSSSGESGLAAAIAGLRGASSSSGTSSSASRGFLSRTGSLGNETVGTVLLVDGSTIYVTTSGGGIVKVRTSPATTVELAQSGSVSELKPGSSVVVAGTTSSDGTVDATTVSQSASAATAGGF